MSETYSVKQIAKLLGYSTNSIYTFLKEKRLKGVRVGKRSLRIPQEELDKLLGSSSGGGTRKNLKNEVAGQEEKKSAATPVPVFAEREISAGPVPEKLFPTGDIEVPSIFDLFVGTSSILLGASLFLFSKLLGVATIDPFRYWLVPVQATLICAGAGLIVTDASGRSKTYWYTVFQSLLIAAYLAYSMMRWYAGDYGGSSLFGALAVVMLIVVLFRIKALTAFSSYITIIILSAPLALYFWPDKLSCGHFFNLKVGSPQFLAAGILMAVIATAVHWWGFVKAKAVYRVFMFILGMIFIGQSAWHANCIEWGRAFFALTLGLISSFIPVWDTLVFSHKDDRKLVFNTFGWVIFLMLMAVLLVRTIQENLISYARTTLVSKAEYTALSLEAALKSANDSLESTGANIVVVNALTEKDDEALRGYIRGLYESNRSFASISIMDAASDFSVTYPLTTLPQPGKESKDQLISRITKGLRRTVSLELRLALPPSIVLSTPIYTLERKVLGAVVGNMDIEALSNKLQRSVSPRDGEYVVVIDEQKRRFIHPDSDYIGSVADKTDPVTLGLEGRSGIGEGFTYKGVRSLVAYTPVNNGWSISAESPVVSVMQVSRAGVVSLLLVFVLLSAAITMYWTVRRNRKRRETLDGN